MWYMSDFEAAVFLVVVALMVALTATVTGAVTRQAITKQSEKLWPVSGLAPTSDFVLCRFNAPVQRLQDCDLRVHDEVAALSLLLSSGPVQSVKLY